ncbi:hypothetical protein SK854_04255 [Lentzea sp. BCCO 10_0061]|uniref:Transposase n=1 Tax=Lentzea sokolovensis TaxID=3095429 RepID=A0ABU4UP94_9PSEU|nr:hypothetical protein [Lentzea sp. BCCO 10_0061]MDX8141312.1 hypothetical protein [Lentzea sp. BCCO 10_0061]
MSCAAGEARQSGGRSLPRGLGLEDIDAIVAHLSGPLDADEVHFDDDASRKWPQDLDAITAAPNRLPAGADPRDQVGQLIGTTQHTKNSRVLSRLVTAQWLYGDPLADPFRTLRQTIATALDHIVTQVHGAGALVLLDRAGAYRKGLH